MTYTVRQLQWDDSENGKDYRGAAQGYNCVYFIELMGDVLTCSKMSTLGFMGARDYLHIPEGTDAKAVCQMDFEVCVAKEFLTAVDCDVEGVKPMLHTFDDSD